MPRNVPTSAAPTLMPDLLNRTVDGFHREDDPENGRDDSEGREGVGNLGDGRRRLLFVLMVHFQILVHEHLEIHCRNTAHDEDLYRITEKVEGVVVRQELRML